MSNQLDQNSNNFQEVEKDDSKKNSFTGGFWQLTPFGKIRKEIIEKNLSRDPIRLFIPTIPLPAIEIKYFSIQFGRFIVSTLLAIALSLAISSTPSQEAFQARVIDRFLPKLQIPFADLKLNLDTSDLNSFNLDRFFNNNLNSLNSNLENISEEIINSPKQIDSYVKREFWRNLWFNLIVGGAEIGIALRAIFFYFLISILYKNNRRDWKSLEREVAKEKFNSAKLAENILDIIAINLNLINQNSGFSPQEMQKLQQLTIKSQKNKTVSKEEINLIILALKSL